MEDLASHILYLLDPRHSPSYWQTPSLDAFGGSPLMWEITSLLVCAGSVFVVVRHSHEKWFGYVHVIALCAAPMFVGLVGTFYIAQLWSLWGGLSPVSEQMQVAITLPAHVGIACSVIVAAAAGAVSVIRRRARTI